MKKFILIPLIFICYTLSAQQPPKTATFYAFDNSTPQIQLVSPDGASVNEIGTDDGGDFAFYLGGVISGDRIRIAKSTGFVGINNPVPSRQLDVVGSAAVSSFLFSNKERIGGNLDGNAWTLGLNGDQIIREGKLWIVSPTPADSDPNTYEEFGLVLTNPDETNKWNFQFNNEFLDLDLWNNEILKGYFKDDTGEYIEVSDRGLKKDVQGMETVLEKINKLEPVSYRYKSNNDESSKIVGLMAQEVHEQFPELASVNEGHMGIAYSKLSVVAIKAIQEQQEIIEDLQAELEAIKKLLEEK